jgi:hypothetical protein
MPHIVGIQSECAPDGRERRALPLTTLEALITGLLIPLLT